MIKRIRQQKVTSNKYDVTNNRPRTPKLNMRREKGSKRDKEDSGVHLEEPLQIDSKTSWDAELPKKTPSTYVISSFKVPKTESMSQSDEREQQLARSFQASCTTTTPSISSSQNPIASGSINQRNKEAANVQYRQPYKPVVNVERKMVVQTKESLLTPRFVKDIKEQGTHSQHHTSRIQDTPMAKDTSKSSTKKTLKTSSSSKSVLERFRRLPVPKKESPRSSLSPPITPESKSDSTAYATFSFGSDSETEESTTSTYYTGGACADVTTSSHTPQTNTYSQSQSQRERKRDRNKLRFKKILRPIRRSHSAGCAKDVPAHALFLKHQESEDRGERRSVDTGRGSMERSDSESETENYNPEKQSSCTPTKPKKKSLAQEMKEKLAFLRRRHTDTSISGKDADKPTPEVALDWSKSFDNLLNDRYGLELFREFLRTEFSEENIEFWIACEEYKTLKTTNYSPLAQRIYTDYVAIQAPREVNLDSKTRLKTVENLDNPDRGTFEIAQKRIQALMAKDSYPRFLQSSVYQDLLGEYKNRLKLKS